MKGQSTNDYKMNCSFCCFLVAEDEKFPQFLKMAMGVWKNWWAPEGS